MSKKTNYDRNHKHTGSIKPFAQKLRREMTPEERRLWYDYLKALPVTVKRQEPIGPYIADFYVPAYRTVIEADGKQHVKGEVFEKDVKRDAYLSSLDLRVLRVYNEDVRSDFTGVCRQIDAFLHLAAEQSELPVSSPQGEGVGSQAFVAQNNKSNHNS